MLCERYNYVKGSCCKRNLDNSEMLAIACGRDGYQMRFSKWPDNATLTARAEEIPYFHRCLLLSERKCPKLALELRGHERRSRCKLLRISNEKIMLYCFICVLLYRI